MNYYEKELQQIDPKSIKDFTPYIKVFTMNGQKYLSLNEESAALIELLQKNYIKKAQKRPKKSTYINL